jgi:hypothetical protein
VLLRASIVCNSEGGTDEILFEGAPDWDDHPGGQCPYSMWG